MSNFAEHEHLPHAAQLIASPDDQKIGAKTRATPRRIPGLSKTDERGFVKSDRELLGGKKKPGSLYATLMLGQLRHDFERDRDGNPGHAQKIHEGQFWVAYSLTYWERQLGLTENEARSGVQCLANSDGVVVVKKFKFGNEPQYMHFRLTEKALGYVPATPLEGGCVPTTQGVCGNHTATTPTVCSPTVLKDSNKHSLSGDAAGPCPENYQANREDQTPKSKAPPDAVKKVTKFSGKNKPGPKPKAVTPSGDWQHYKRLEQNHDMDTLLQTCKNAGFVASHRTLLSDPECSRLEAIERELSKTELEDTLESLLLTVGKKWLGMCENFEEHAEKTLHMPPTPRLDFLRTHIHRLFELAEVYRVVSAPPAFAAYDDETCTYQETLDAWAAEAERAIAQTMKPIAHAPVLTASANMPFSGTAKCHA